MEQLDAVEHHEPLFGSFTQREMGIQWAVLI
jgi:hypothetical protein